MSVRSDELGIVQSAAAGITKTVFTVPAGETWIVKRATCYNLGVVTGTALWVVTPVASSATGVHRASVAAGSADDHETWWACGPGTKLEFANTGTATMTCLAFGAKLIGAA